MKTIYEPRGRAREYAELAANLYSGCDHGCLYCYAPAALKRTREQFNKPEPRAAIIRKLCDDAEEMRKNKDQRNVLLCFTCDAYQSINDRYKLARQAIQVFQNCGIKYAVLTKGGKRSEQDFDIWDPALGTYAATLVFTDEAQRQKYEPDAAPTVERIAALKRAHDLDIKTWVSLEPVFDPVQTYELIRQTHDFVDLYKVGKLNYLDEARAVNWRDFAQSAISLIESFGNAIYVKNDLRRFLNA
jgi:DNA repair photolyase